VTVTTVRYPPHSYLERPAPSGLAEVVDLILEKGLVIDVFVRVALVGIEILTIDARIVVASVDTYLRFAEAVERLDLSRKEPRQLPEFLAEVKEKVSRRVAKGAATGIVEAGKEKVREALRGDAEQGDGEERARTRGSRGERGL